MNTGKDFYSTVDLPALYESVLNSLNAQVAVLNQDSNIVAHNKQWLTLREQQIDYWLRPDLGENYLQVLQEPLKNGNDFALRFLLGLKAILNGENSEYELRYPIKTPTHQYWFKVTARKLDDQDGVILIHEDMSSELQKKKEVREAEHRFQLHFENNLYGILETDEHHRILKANREAAHILDKPLSELVHTPLADFLEMKSSIRDLQKQINKKGNFLGEFELTNGSGEIVPVELSAHIHRDGQGTLLTTWSIKDIRDKKKAERALAKREQQYKLQFNNTLEGIIIGRPDGLILEANPAACDILGFDRQELVGGYRSLFFEDDLAVNKTALEQRNKEGLFTGDVIFTHRRGHNIQVRINSVIIYDKAEQEERTILTFSDITEKRQTEQELRRAKDFNELAVAGANLGLWEVNLETSEASYNDRWHEMLGYSADDIEHSQEFFYQILHPEDRHVPKQELERVLKEGGRYETEFRMRAKCGKYRWILAIAKIVERDEDGQPSRLAGSHLDITERKEAEESSKRNQLLLNQLFQNSPLGIVQLDEDGKVLDINQSFENIFGYNLEELNGKRLDSHIAPDELEQSAINLSMFTLGGDTFQTETVRMHKDGRKIPVVVGGVPVALDDNVISIYGMYLDISERKKLESQILDLLETEKKARLHMEDMFEESPSGIAMLEGKSHRFSFVNKEFKTITGNRDLLDHSIAEVLPELGGQGIIREMNEVYFTGETRRYKEKRVQFEQADGDPKQFYLDCVFKPLRGEDGEIYGIFVETIDVTEQVEARNIVEKSLSEKETLLNEVHHRVKNNLAIITGLLELEAMNIQDPRTSRYLHTSQSRINSIAKIHELLYQNESLSHVHFNEYIDNPAFLESILTPRDLPRLFDQVEADDVYLNVNQAIPAAMLLNEINNYLADQVVFLADHRPSRITFRLKVTGNEVQFIYTDPDKSALTLFSPDNENMDSMRSELIKALSTQIDARLEYESHDHASVTISFIKQELSGPHNSLDQEF